MEKNSLLMYLTINLDIQDIATLNIGKQKLNKM